MQVDRSKPTLYYEKDLPKLPIPDLDATCVKYLKTLDPVLDKGEKERVTKYVDDFKAGFGKVLQERLLEYAKTAENSWLEKWWLEYAYHGWRESVMINSNWYVLFKDHPQTPRGYLDDGSPNRPKAGEFTPFQVQRAAGVIASYLAYNELVKAQKIPVDGSQRTGPQCMNQYYQLFGVTRVPRKGVDTLERHPESKHIAVLARDQIFIVPVYNLTTNEPLSEAIIEALLWKIIRLLVSSTQQPPISLLTSLHRDVWAEAYAYLELKSALNVQNLQKINTALFCVCLDDYCVSTRMSAFSRNAFHGQFGHNRWFDKSMSLVITNDGRMGKNGEHSPCDALIPSLIVSYAVQQEQSVEGKNAPVHFSAVPNLCSQIEHLSWVVDETVSQFIYAADINAKALVANSDVDYHTYGGFGFELLKKAKLSPDAFAQMALQAAYFKVHKKVTPVYETAATRTFFHGRTETCRSLSAESKAFVIAFDSDPSLKNKGKLLELLRVAIKAHNKYMAEASLGKGVDRHLLGLKLSLKPGELSKAPIYTDPSFVNSMWFRLSTSALPYSPFNIGTGFGSVVPDGYGINYVVGPNWFRFGIESKFSDPVTSSSLFGDALSQVLERLKLIITDVSCAKL